MDVSEKAIFRQKKGIASDAFVRSWRSYRALTNSGTAVNKSASSP